MTTPRRRRPTDYGRAERALQRRDDFNVFNVLTREERWGWIKGWLAGWAARGRKGRKA